MVKVNTTFFQQCGNCGKVGFSTIDVIFAGVVFEGSSRYDQGRVRNNFVLSIGLLLLAWVANCHDSTTYKIHDLLEMHFNLTKVQVRKCCGIVY